MKGAQSSTRSRADQIPSLAFFYLKGDWAGMHKSIGTGREDHIWHHPPNSAANFPSTCVML